MSNVKPPASLLAQIEAEVAALTDEEIRQAVLEVKARQRVRSRQVDDRAQALGLLTCVRCKEYCPEKELTEGHCLKCVEEIAAAEENE